MENRLLTQREAAAALHVSVSYLRASDCPKLLLPGNGRTGKPLVRYDWNAMVDWAARRPRVLARVA